MWRFLCRYERENSQKHLEESRLNLAMRREGAGQSTRGREEREREEERGQVDQGRREEPREYMDKTAGLYRNNLGEGKGSPSPGMETFRVEGRVRRTERSHRL